MNIAIKYYCIRVLRELSKSLFFFPLRNEQIMFYSYAGKQYSDSPKYISDYIQEHDTAHQYQLIWAVNDPACYKGLETSKLHFIKYKGLRFTIEYARSKCIITNMGPIRAIARRRDQEVIVTWHGGGAYKKVGTIANHKADSKYQIRYSEMAMKDVTVFLSSSKAFTEACIHDSHHYYGKVLNVGLPRNDVLLDTNLHEIMKKKVLNYFNIDQDIRMVLYAPTWRNYDSMAMERIDFESLVSSLSTKFGGRWGALYRAHNLMIQKEELESNNSLLLLDATEYPDMQELLIASDILVTDYSSSIWDYSLLKKPAFLFVPDLDYYEKQFGFCSPISEWGFEVCKTNERLKQSILNYETERQMKAIHENHVKFQNYETGHACKSVYEYIESKRTKREG